MNNNDSTFWKQKLLAFLHDPPCKCFDIAQHEQRAMGFRSEAGITSEEYLLFQRAFDHVASAADRFPFPKSTVLKSPFDGQRAHPFQHPAGGSQLIFSESIATADLAEDIFQQAIKGVDYDLDWKRKYFLYWRRWPEQAAQVDKRLAYLPADTRLPDHTIWTHMSLTSALSACVDEQGIFSPAFLLFKFGPVQNFIQQARSLRDLWSGSYLLSWLMAVGLKEIADHVGPDALIFPSVRGKPLFDLQYRKEIYETIHFAQDNLWERMNYSTEQLATPGLPNSCLALVPADKAVDIATQVSNALKSEWCQISQSCKKAFNELVQRVYGSSTKSHWLERWDRQVDRFLEITWQVWPWIDNPVLDSNLQGLKRLAEETIPESDREPFYFNAKNVRHGLSNLGFLWSAQYQIASALFAARRNTREFTQNLVQKNPPVFEDEGALKDALSGKQEIIGDRILWDQLRKDGTIFKSNEGPYGAIQIIKRLWVRSDHSTYLNEHVGQNLHLRFNDTEALAGQDKYFAILALDGDHMGRWISGENAPTFLGQLSPEAREYFAKMDGIESLKRAVSPSYHLQFSEALSNFSQVLVRPVVEIFDGQLIYAGGDDVLAMLPAKQALACAYTLRILFQGQLPDCLRQGNSGTESVQMALKNFEITYPGWVTYLQQYTDKQAVFPLLVPGPRADVSCGIAYAHIHHPLQAVVREAHLAERRAKDNYGRAAFAFSLLKRGGETLYWGGKWDQHAIPLYYKYLALKDQNKVSARFPYALADLVAPYALDAGELVDGLDPEMLLKRELVHVVEHQGGYELKDLAFEYLNELVHKGYGENALIRNAYRDFAKLFLAAAFIERNKEEV